MRGRTNVLPRFLAIQAFFRNDRQVLKGRNSQAQGVNPVLQGVHRKTYWNPKAGRRDAHRAARGENKEPLFLINPNRSLETLYF